MWKYEIMRFIVVEYVISSLSFVDKIFVQDEWIFMVVKDKIFWFHDWEAYLFTWEIEIKANSFVDDE